MVGPGLTIEQPRPHGERSEAVRRDLFELGRTIETVTCRRSTLKRASGTFSEQDDVFRSGFRGAVASGGHLAATGRRRRAAGQLESGEGSGQRAGALQEAAAVDAEPRRRLVDGLPDQLVERPVA